ncbi:hypothetical protein Tco_0247573 [Tanacetum coccineum]
MTQDRFRLSVFPVSLAGVASEWFKKDCIGSVTTWDDLVEKFVLKFHHRSDNNEEKETEEDDYPNETDNVPKIFKIEGKLFDFETPLCKAFNEFNYLLKIDTDLFTYNIQNFKTYDEYERELNNDIARGPEEPWSENGVPYQLYHKWYDELADGKLKEETLALKAKVKRSWGDATPEVIKFCVWLKNSFENFYELDYDVLVKLQECWWKVNAHDIAPFTRMENFRRGTYANMKTNLNISNEKNKDHHNENNRDADKLSGMDLSGAPQSKKMNNEQPNEGVYRVDKFEVIKYTIGGTIRRILGFGMRRIDPCTVDLAETMIWYILKRTCAELIRAF